MPILDYLLLFALGVVIYHTGKKMYILYTIHRMNMAIIDLYTEAPNLTLLECKEAEEVIKEAEDTGADMRYIQTARTLIKIQRKILNAQNTSEDGL